MGLDALSLGVKDWQIFGLASRSVKEFGEGDAGGRAVCLVVSQLSKSRELQLGYSYSLAMEVKNCVGYKNTSCSV